MHVTETVLLVLLGGLLAAQCVPRIPRSVIRVLYGLSLLAFLLGLWLDQARWQLLPAWLLLAWLSRQLLARKDISQRRPPPWLLAGGVLALTVSLLLGLGLPVLTLPAPAGSWPVGTTVLTLQDSERDDSALGAPGELRTLSLQLWYPAVADNSRPPRPLWAELYRGRTDLIALLTGYLHQVPTHSRQDVPPALGTAPWPVLVYSHGLSLFPEQNTLLMEHLASQGYLVVAVGHTRMSTRVLLDNDEPVYSAVSRIRSALQQSNTQATPEQVRRLALADSRLERAGIALESIEASTDLNALMAIWVEDLRFVLDALTVNQDQYPALQTFTANGNPERIGLLGMSFGGGAITEVCKVDARCKAGLNLDGGIFGSYQRHPLQVPHLVLASPANVPYFEYQLLQSEAPHYLVVVAGSTHADFMDLILTLPLLKWLGVGGTIHAERVIDLMNTVAARFFDAWLRDGPSPEFDTVAYPELTVERQDQTSTAVLPQTW